MFKAFANFFSRIFNRQKVEPARPDDPPPVVEMPAEKLVPEKFQDLFTLETYDKHALWYPLAVKEKPMAVQGKYPGGYPMGLCFHFTAGRGTAQSTMQYGRSKTSVPNLYMCTGRDGTMFQGDALTDFGWHSGATGGSNFVYQGQTYSNTSKYLVGVETVCAGMVENLRNGFMRPWWSKGPKDDIPEYECRHFEGNAKQVEGWYHKFTKEQEEAVFHLCLWLKWNWPAKFHLELVLGHDELCVRKGSKNDPGGSLSMPMYEFRNKLTAKYAELLKTIKT